MLKGASESVRDLKVGGNWSQREEEAFAVRRHGCWGPQFSSELLWMGSSKEGGQRETGDLSHLGKGSSLADCKEGRAGGEIVIHLFGNHLPSI